MTLDAEPPLGIRRSELIVKDVAPKIIEVGLAEYRAWCEGRDATVTTGSRPSIATRTVTQWARTEVKDRLDLPPVEIIEIKRDPDRPSGRRFGALVHAVLGVVPLDGNTNVVLNLAELEGRVLGATEDEIASAARAVHAVLGEPILKRASEAAKLNRCRRETPVAWRDRDGLIEGVIDLAFEEEDRWILVDFKTDDDSGTNPSYERQLGLYALTVEAACAKPVSALLLRV